MSFGGTRCASSNYSELNSDGGYHLVTGPGGAASFKESLGETSGNSIMLGKATHLGADRKSLDCTAKPRLPPAKVESPFCEATATRIVLSIDLVA
jgi:hypothetical protein